MGHEIVGNVVKVGKDVTHLKVYVKHTPTQHSLSSLSLLLFSLYTFSGDRVAVGAQADSCRECDYCKAGNIILLLCALLLSFTLLPFLIKVQESSRIVLET